MTLQELRKLPVGTRVGWTLNSDGDEGTVALGSDKKKCIHWDDGQVTEGFDDGALPYVVVLGEPKAVKP